MKSDGSEQEERKEKKKTEESLLVHLGGREEGLHRKSTSKNGF